MIFSFSEYHIKAYHRSNLAPGFTILLLDICFRDLYSATADVNFLKHVFQRIQSAIGIHWLFPHVNLQEEHVLSSAIWSHFKFKKAVFTKSFSRCSNLLSNYGSYSLSTPILSSNRLTFYQALPSGKVNFRIFLHCIPFIFLLSLKMSCICETTHLIPHRLYLLILSAAKLLHLLILSAAKLLHLVLLSFNANLSFLSSLLLRGFLVQYPPHLFEYFVL